MSKNASALTGLFFAASSLTILTISTVKSFLRKQTMVAVLLTVASAETAVATGSFLASAFGKSAEERKQTPALSAAGYELAEKKKAAPSRKKDPHPKRDSGSDFFLRFFDGERSAEKTESSASGQNPEKA